jgi:hypothetical protein
MLSYSDCHRPIRSDTLLPKHRNRFLQSSAYLLRWKLQTLHASRASVFFICIYINIWQNMLIYCSSYKLVHAWSIGAVIPFVTIAGAFIGYVLPWGRISFWGASVITNLLSAVPYIGTDLVQWVWGGSVVDNVTLTRFFALRFLIPFDIAALVIVQLLFLHQIGSRHPVGLKIDTDKFQFHRSYCRTRHPTCNCINTVAKGTLHSTRPWQLHWSKPISDPHTHSTRISYWHTQSYSQSLTNWVE